MIAALAVAHHPPPQLTRRPGPPPPAPHPADFLAYFPTSWKIQNHGITSEEAAALRQSYKGPHNVFTTSDGVTLFLRRWNPDTLTPAKKDG